MVQQLSDDDHRRRVDFCLQLQDLVSSDDHFVEKVRFSDEATFHVSGAVNRHNVTIWGSENPHAYVEHQRDSPKGNVFVQSPVKNCTVPSSLLKKPLVA